MNHKPSIGNLGALVLAGLVIQATAASDIPENLPRPDGKPGDNTKPVKIFRCMFPALFIQNPCDPSMNEGSSAHAQFAKIMNLAIAGQGPINDAVHDHAGKVALPKDRSVTLVLELELTDEKL